MCATVLDHCFDSNPCGYIMSMLTTIFWVFWVLCLVGVFAPANAYFVKGSWVLVLLLIGILGFKLLGNPIR